MILKFIYLNKQMVAGDATYSVSLQVKFMPSVLFYFC